MHAFEKNNLFVVYLLRCQARQSQHILKKICFASVPHLHNFKTCKPILANSGNVRFHHRVIHCFAYFVLGRLN